MDIRQWLNSRAKASTIDGTARRILQSGKAYGEIEKGIRQKVVFEALIANDGDYTKTADQLGVHRNTVGRTARAMGLTCRKVREIAKAVKVQQ